MSYLLLFILGGAMLERNFQPKTIKEIREMFPGCFVLKCDGSNTPQGFPDILILYKDKWAVLEFKKSQHEKFQPNQKHYIEKLGEVVYARVIYPENKEEVLDGLQRAFRA